VEAAVERLRTFEPPEGYYLAFSGGKDSITLLRLAQMAGVQYDAHYNVTTVDPPELLRFIRREHPSVTWDRPELTMWQLIIKNGIPPTRLVRYCCAELKERGGSDRLKVTGIRWAESNARAQRQMVETCRYSNARILHPIIDWTDDDVWQFIRQEKLPYCELYDEGQKRIGCVMCPMGNHSQMAWQAQRWPRIAGLYLRAFDRMIAHWRERGKPRRWNTAEEVMAWWTQDTRQQVPDEQIPMFA